MYIKLYFLYPYYIKFNSSFSFSIQPFKIYYLLDVSNFSYLSYPIIAFLIA